MVFAGFMLYATSLVISWWIAGKIIDAIVRLFKKAKGGV